MNNPELIVLDEPFSGLDPVNIEMLSEVMKELIAQREIRNNVKPPNEFNRRILH